MARLIVNIDVPDLEHAVRFYTEAFSLRLSRRLGDAFVELSGAGVPICILVKPTHSAPFSGAPMGRHYGRHWTPVHLDFVVDDLEAAALRAQRAGAISEGPPSEHVWGRMALLADPFGHGICLLEFKGR